MIIINELHGGRFGNKILHYNNLAQIAKSLNTDYNSIPYEGYEFLNLKNNVNFFNHNAFSFISSKTDFSSLDKNLNYSLQPCLGELFFKFNYSTREIFSIKGDVLDKQYKNIGIHFRGGDFHSWNPESILSTEYYINSIESLHTDNNKYYLFTDDMNLKSYEYVLTYLTEKNYTYELGVATLNNSHFINDYFQLCDCDYIISSPSTFAICAGFMGKEKEIIHSKKWIDSRVAKNDSFWMGANNGGNDNYKIKLIL